MKGTHTKSYFPWKYPTAGVDTYFVTRRLRSPSIGTLQKDMQKDMAMKYSTEAKFYCFADSVDPLIEVWCEIVLTGEKQACSPGT